MREHIVLIGRTNVGKSTLFNRILGRRRAIVHDRPGTTRDRNETVIAWKDREFTLVDTGGWAHDNEIFSAPVKRQLEIALERARLAVLVVDGKHGFHPLDAELNSFVRRQGKNVILAVNKVDSGSDEMKVADFYRLGVDEIVPLSAEHGRNIFELLDRIVASLAPVEPEIPAGGPGKQAPVRIILVGKPNVGKSSLVNTLSKQERSIVHDLPGTTRDTLDVALRQDGREYLLIDTPGLHRRRTFKDDIDYLATLSAHHAMERADVAVLVMDASQGVGETEARVAELILENRKGCLLVLNKWDLIEGKEEAAAALRRQIEEKLSFLSWARLLLISAKTGQRTHRILTEVDEIYQQFARVVPEDELREVIRAAEAYKPLSRRGEILRIREVRQVDEKPPTFSFAVNRPDIVHFSYRRYLENRIREHFGFTGTPLVLRFHKYVPKEKVREI